MRRLNLRKLLLKSWISFLTLTPGVDYFLVLSLSSSLFLFLRNVRSHRARRGDILCSLTILSNPDLLYFEFGEGALPPLSAEKAVRKIKLNELEAD